ncbi:MAG: hypothetical protein L6Q97_13330 [Thermoanaerobaculia bacterium]|nr:hypothetical protein [Thermoanaerobaculia bacterium]
MKYRLTLFLALLTGALFAQNTITLQRTLNWAAEPRLQTLPHGETVEIWGFEQCLYGDAVPGLPYVLPCPDARASRRSS